MRGSPRCGITPYKAPALRSCAKPAAWPLEAGIRLCGPIHDAILVECAITEIDQAINRVTRIMVEATRLVLNDGQALHVGDLIGDVRVDHKVYAHPIHINEGRDNAVWQLITRMREEDGYAPIQ